MHLGRGSAFEILDPKIRIDQDQGFQRQVLKLQIPGGMIDGDIADVIDVVLFKPDIGIVDVNKGPAAYLFSIRRISQCHGRPQRLILGQDRFYSRS